MLNEREKDKNLALLVLFYSGSTQKLEEIDIDSYCDMSLLLISVTFVCSEIKSLLCSAPQEADNLQATVQLRPTSAVGNQKAGRRMAVITSLSCRLTEAVTSLPRSLWTFPPMRSLMESPGSCQHHRLPLNGRNFLLLLILGLSPSSLVGFLLLVMLCKYFLVSDSFY